MSKTQIATLPPSEGEPAGTFIESIFDYYRNKKIKMPTEICLGDILFIHVILAKNIPRPNPVNYSVATQVHGMQEAFVK